MKMKHSIASSLDARLSGVVMRDEVKASVLSQVRGEKKYMKRKLSAVMVFALIALLLTTGAAVAATAGVFQFFAQKNDFDQEIMNALSQNAVDIGDVQTIPADSPYPAITFTVDQAFYDGDVLYLSYAMSGASAVVEDGFAPSAEELSRMEPWEAWDLPEELKDRGTDAPWGATEYIAYPGDGLFDVETDEYLCPSMGDQEEIDGTVMSYFRFDWPLPAAFQNKDALTVYYKWYRAANHYYFDGENYWFSADRQEMRFAPVRIPRAAQNAVWTASREFADYGVTATVTASQVDMRMEVSLTNVPDGWKQALNTAEKWDLDAPCDYQVFFNGEKSPHLESECVRIADGIRYVFIHSRPESVQEIRLVPVYSKTGLHESEALIITP